MITYKGTDKIKVKFKTAARNIGPASNEWLRSKARPLINSVIEAHFKRGGDESGAWEPLADWTVRERLEQGFGGSSPILYRTGGLLNEVTGKSRNNSRISSGAGWSSLTFFLVSQKAMQLQMGNEFTLPARPFMTLGRNEYREVERSFNIFLRKLVDDRYTY